MPTVPCVPACLRELLDGHNLVKLEVLGDEKTLYPNITETLKAARTLIDDGLKSALGLHL